MSQVLMICPDAQMIDRRVLQSARSLRAAGFDVELVSGMECAADEHLVLDGIDIHRYAFDWHDPRTEWWGKLRPVSARLVQRGYDWYQRRGQHLRRDNTFDHFVLRKLADFRPDLVYVHDLPFLPYGHRIARRHGVPLVFDAHEIYYEQESLPLAARDRLRRIERRLIRDVDLFVTVNEFIARWFSERYPGVEPVSVHNSLPDFPLPDRTAARTRLEAATGFAPSDVIVLYQGWISAERNLATMVRSFACVGPEVKLAVVGYGEHIDDLRAVAAELGREGAVRFLGRMEQADLLAITPGADLGIIPYLPIDLNHELCSPNKFFEFVQNGVPVLAHRSPFFVTMAERLGVVEPADLSSPDSFGAALGQLVGSPARLAAMRAACQQHRRELAWEPSYAPVVERCGELLERTTVRRRSSRLAALRAGRFDNG